MNPKYAMVGFDLHGNGGHGEVINVPWKTREECLKRCGRVLMSFIWFLLWWRWWSHALGERYTFMLCNQQASTLLDMYAFVLVFTFVLFVWFTVSKMHTSDKNRCGLCRWAEHGYYAWLEGTVVACLHNQTPSKPWNWQWPLHFLCGFSRGFKLVCGKKYGWAISLFWGLIHCLAFVYATMRAFHGSSKCSFWYVLTVKNSIRLCV